MAKRRRKMLNDGFDDFEVVEAAKKAKKKLIIILSAIILVVISVLLTMIAGLIPARSAANKDPVIALRSE